jgi:hypothetical protein
MAIAVKNRTRNYLDSSLAISTGDLPVSAASNMLGFY